MFNREITRLIRDVEHYMDTDYGAGDEAVAYLLLVESYINRALEKKQAALEAEYDSRVDEVKKALYDEGSLKSALIEEEEGPSRYDIARGSGCMYCDGAVPGSSTLCICGRKVETK